MVLQSVPEYIYIYISLHTHTHIHPELWEDRSKNNGRKMKIGEVVLKIQYFFNVTMHFSDVNGKTGGERVVIFSMAWKKGNNNKKNKSGLKSHSVQKLTNKQQPLLL